jgi:hypothetical protein
MPRGLTCGGVRRSILLGLLPAVTRGSPQDSMQGGRDITAHGHSSRDRDASMAGWRWRSILRPCAPGLFALAVAVFLWGLGYKLSLYHHHAAPVGRTVVAKLWTDPRGVLVSSDLPSRRSAHVPASRQLLPTPAGLFTPFCSHVADPAAELLNAATFQRSRLPSRSPPSQENL